MAHLLLSMDCVPTCSYPSQFVYRPRLHQALLPFCLLGFWPQIRSNSVSIRKQGASCNKRWIKVYVGSGARGRASAVAAAVTALAAEKAPSAEELKLQLEALQRESEQVRARANSARSRFMRLTEAAEKLRMRAAFDVKSGREDSARQLLAEKQKVMKALQNSNRRVEVLEELSAKLAEAISTKETQLIAALSSGRLKMFNDDDSTHDAKTVVVSPSGESSVIDDMQTWHENNLARGMAECSSSDDTVHEDDVEDIHALNHNSDFNNEPEEQNGLDLSLSFGPHNYSSFLTDIDSQLKGLELKIQDFMYIAAMILQEPVEATANSRVVTMKQIWRDIQNVRSRIHQAFDEDIDVATEEGAES